MSPFRGGSILWSARRPQVSGSLVVLHLLPQDATALREIERLADGDCARLTGREETDGEIRGTDGAYAKLNSENHRYLLVEKVRPCG